MDLIQSFFSTVYNIPELIALVGQFGLIAIIFAETGLLVGFFLPGYSLLVTAGLSDPRVTYWEPAKWVARLREMKTDDNALLLKTNMGAGHGGKSGRYVALEEAAEEFRASRSPSPGPMRRSCWSSRRKRRPRSSKTPSRS